MRDFAIIGAGLAGLLLVRRLLERGVDAEQIVLLDSADAERASDVPSALMHPFPGRSMQPKPGQLDSARASVDALRGLRNEVGADAVLELPMARPLLGDLGDKLRDSWQEAHADYPDWLDSRLVSGEALSAVDPNLSRFDEALVYTPAFSVDTRAVRRHLRDAFIAAGARVLASTPVDALEPDDGQWMLHTPGESLRARHVVLAVGAGIGDWFPGLPMQNRGGEVWVARPPDDARLTCVINASGHVAPGPDGTWVAGSTYFSPEDFAERDDATARQELLERCARLTPALADAETVSIWRGVRAMYRGDNRPLVGSIPGQPRLYVFGALGSKGLLRIPELANQLADHLLDDAPIDERAETGRVKDEKWEPAAARFRSLSE